MEERFRLYVHRGFIGYRKQEPKGREGLLLLEEVLNTDDFKQAILNFQHPEGGHRFDDSQHSGAQILKNIYQKRKIKRQLRYGAKLRLLMINGSGPTGRELGKHSYKKIYTYRENFKKASLPVIANHYLHEWLHGLGYKHEFHNPSPSSVPYALGLIAEELSTNMAWELLDQTPVQIGFSVLPTREYQPGVSLYKMLVNMNIRLSHKWRFILIQLQTDYK